MNTSSPTIINPTIGRRVWFWPSKRTGQSGFICHDAAVPMDAGIVFVHSDRCVNLDVCDHAGNHHAFTSVYLDQGDDCPSDPDAARCEWMPFQKGRAARQEAQAKEPAVLPRIATHRQELEHSAAHALASRVAEVGHSGSRLGKEVRESLDALLGEGETMPEPRLIALSVRDLCAAAGVTAEWPVGQGLTFGDALAELKKGRRVARAGWNGKGMFIYLQDGSINPNGHDAGKFAANYVNGVDVQLFNCGDKGTVTRMPCICMHAADGSTVTGWLASQTDMLAEDWAVLHGEASTTTP